MELVDKPSLACGETYLLPSPDDLPIAHQTLPRQPLHLGLGAERGALGCLEELTATGREGEALRGEVVADEAEDALGKQIGADVEVAGIAGTKHQGLLGEAVLGDMGVRGRQEGLFLLVERAGLVWVVVGVVRGGTAAGRGRGDEGTGPAAQAQGLRDGFALDGGSSVTGTEGACS